MFFRKPMSDIAIIGQKDLILALGALGIGRYYADDSTQAKAAIAAAEKDGAKIIFIFEKLAAGIIDLIKEKIYPAVVVIPDNAGSIGLASGIVKKAATKAIGSETLTI
ncbi:MAG: V-type ATP synthase subunit F [Candidatus Omnitrophota bacterium]